MQVTITPGKQAITIIVDTVLFYYKTAPTARGIVIFNLNTPDIPIQNFKYKTLTPATF